MVEPLIEVEQPEPTHGASRTLPDGSSQWRESQMDRFYFSAAEVLLPQIIIRCSVVGPLRDDRPLLSDHRPVTARFTLRAPTPAHLRPIPFRATARPDFGDALRARRRRRPPRTDKWRRAKQEIRRVAADTIRRALNAPAKTPQSRRQAALQLSRAVARRDARAARRAIAALPDAEACIAINDGEITDQPRLDDIIADIMRRAVRCDVDDDERRTDDTRRDERPRRRRPILDILTKLWGPYVARTYLATVIDGSGTRLTNDAEKAAELGRYWQATFERRGHNPAASAAVTAANATPLDYGPLPTATTLAGAFRRARRSAPGLDGIPATAWAASGHDGARIVQGLLLRLTTRAPTPKSLLRGTMVFPPKPTGEPARDAEWRAARTST